MENVIVVPLLPYHVMKHPNFHFVQMDYAHALKPEENLKEVTEQQLVLAQQLFTSVKKMEGALNASSILSALD